jgi:NADH-quinone oxidoreductase subunit N
MFSTAGVPPFVGFWAKIAVLGAVVDVGLVWLAAVAVLLSVVAAFYYLRVCKVMYFDAPDGDVPALRRDRPLRIAFSVNALVLLVLGLFWNPIMAWCQASFP